MSWNPDLHASPEVRDAIAAANAKPSYGLEAQTAPPIETPAARWRKEGKPDPHGVRYDCERAQLAGGHMTDDELANAVFLDPSIMNLTCAKDRIRWLSRKLAEAQAASN